MSYYRFIIDINSFEKCLFYNMLATYLNFHCSCTSLTPIFLRTYNNLMKRSEQVKTAQEKACKKDTETKDEMIEINKARKKNKSLLEAEEKKLEQYEKLPEHNREVKLCDVYVQSN